MEPLAQRLARGEHAAFAELYDAWADRLHHYLSTRLGGRDWADDVLQETFVRLVRNRQRLAEVNSLAGYVFTIARNEALRFADKKRREPHRIALNVDDLFEKAGEELADIRESIAAALSRLTEEHREVVELKVYGGLTFREIGDVIGVPLATAATRYRTALERLRVLMT